MVGQPDIKRPLITRVEHDHDHGHGHGDGKSHDHTHEHEHGHSHSHSHSRERPGSLPLRIPSQPDLEPQIALDSIDVISDTMSTDGGHKEHRHKVSKSDDHHDYGIAGVMIHIAGDAFNNIGVIIAGLVIWKSTSPHRYYADPTVSMAIALIILVSAVPLGKALSSRKDPLTASSEANRSHPATEPADEHRRRRHQARPRKGKPIPQLPIAVLTPPDPRRGLDP
jgi:hypothetical protein